MCTWRFTLLVDVHLFISISPREVCLDMILMALIKVATCQLILILCLFRRIFKLNWMLFVLEIVHCNFHLLYTQVPLLYVKMSM